MKNKKINPFGKVRILIPVLCLALCFFIFNCNKKDQETTGIQNTVKKEVLDPVFSKKVLTVKDRVITNLDFRKYFESTYQRISIENLGEDILKTIFEKFVEGILVLERISEDSFTVSEEDFRKYLQNFRVSDDTNLKILRNDYTIQKYYAEVVYQGITISDQSVLNYYSKNRIKYKKKAQILLWQIKTKTSPEALKIRTELIKDKNKFEEIAKRESISVDKNSGGRMGYFEKGVLPLVIEKYVFALPLRKISSIIESPYGFHIFKVTEIKDAQTLPMYMVKDEIIQKLTQAETINRNKELRESLLIKYSVSKFYQNLYILDIINKPPKENSENESN